MNLVIRLLELLKGDQTVNLLSIEANTTSIEESTSVNQIVFRLKIEVSLSCNFLSFKQPYFIFISIIMILLMI